MRRMSALLACAALLLVAASASAQVIYAGTVVRVDQPVGVVVLSDGRMFQVVNDSVVLVNNQPVAVSTVQPGMLVTLRSVQPVTYQNGSYIIVTDPLRLTPAPTTSVITAPSAGAVVVQGPPPAVVTAPPPSVTVVPPPPPAVAVAPPPATVMVTPLPAGVVVVQSPAVVPAREIVTGVIRKVDWAAGVILMDDGRIIPFSPGTVVYVNNQVTGIQSLRGGQHVVIHSPGSVQMGGAALPWDAVDPGHEYTGDRGVNAGAP